jgi:hypothetical protein
VSNVEGEDGDFFFGEVDFVFDFEKSDGNI